MSSHIVVLRALVSVLDSIVHCLLTKAPMTVTSMTALERLGIVMVDKVRVGGFTRPRATTTIVTCERHVCLSTWITATCAQRQGRL